MSTLDILGYHVVFVGFVFCVGVIVGRLIGRGDA